jgi:ligand-binding sensor domain-containing protein
VLYVGTDFGAFVSTSAGQRWEVLGGNLPSVQVSDLQYHRRDRAIVIATYGRGMWGMDGREIR